MDEDNSQKSLGMFVTAYNKTLKHALVTGNISLAKMLIKAGAFWKSGESGFYAVSEDSIFDWALKNDDTSMVRWILKNRNIELTNTYMIYCLVKSVIYGYPVGRAWKLLSKQVDMGFLESQPFILPCMVNLVVNCDAESAMRHMVVFLSRYVSPKIMDKDYKNKYFLLEGLKRAVQHDWKNVTRGLLRLTGNSFGSLAMSDLKNTSAELIIMLYRRGWRSKRTMNPMVLQQVAEKLEQAGYTEEGQYFRERSRRSIAVKLAKELERC